ncbi:hypothetical protein, partial [Moraxella sp.]|uniref:hypothetical protein n=1 Tax=Moraxella sp. TaxID=479 RepID=UPI0026DB5325
MQTKLIASALIAALALTACSKPAEEKAAEAATTATEAATTAADAAKHAAENAGEAAADDSNTDDHPAASHTEAP